MSSRAKPYDRAFYDAHEAGSVSSAQAVIPILLELIAPKSVVDVGCGTGVWLEAFRRQGIDDVLGIDGSHVEKVRLRIPAQKFMEGDLSNAITLPRSFDLALCLEVAEHLPADCAGPLVESLIRLSPAILFSAAVPGQGGVNHVNEQWPEYWVKQFQQKGYGLIDCIRPRIWGNPAIDWWYAQNMFLFVKADLMERRPKLKKELDHPGVMPLAAVHPRGFAERIELLRPENLSLSSLLSALPGAAIRAVKRRL